MSSPLRLIDHLRALGYANRAARDLLETGKVAYHGVPTADGGRQVDPARVVISPSAPRLRPNRDLAVVFHDRHLAVVYKPPGMLAVEAPGRRREGSVVGQVRRLFGAGHAVHRLDEPTSGLMMVALTEASQREIKEILFRHEVRRVYLALVSGHFPAAPFTVATQLVRDRGDGLRGSDADGDDEQGKEAVTHFRLVERLGRRASLVEATLETGRTHQVRIHLSERGFPILGDRLYGPRGRELPAERLALHAAELGLRHPVSGEALHFEAPLADDLEQLRRRLGHAQS
ncbi:MAG: RluA family pseudouridine synthase [Deltaproteobacteria bacterium]|nr:RluA family pseudouridine synthase [Deltaproteobacteria bacterium]